MILIFWMRGVVKGPPEAGGLSASIPWLPYNFTLAQQRPDARLTGQWLKFRISAIIIVTIKIHFK